MTASTPPRSPSWRSSSRIIAAVLLLGLLLLTLRRFANLLTPLVLAVMLSYILNPLVVLLAKRTRLPRWAAVLIVYLVLLVVVLGAATAIGVTLGQQVVGLAAGVQEFALSLPERLDQLSQSVVMIGPYPLDLNRIDFRPLLEQLTGAIQPMLARTGSILASIASATASAVGLLLLVLVLGYYILADFPRFDEAGLEIVPESYRPDIARLTRETSHIWSAFLRGQLILAIVIGSVVTVLTTILGVRYPLALGLVSGALEFIPIFGPLIAGAVGVVVALLQTGNWLGLSPFWFAVAVAGMFFLVQQLENNILVPRIIGHSLNLHPLAVIVGAVAGAALAGVLGVMLAAPVIATIRLWGLYTYRKVLDLDPFPPPPPPPLKKTRTLPLARLLRRSRPAPPSPSTGSESPPPSTPPEQPHATETTSP